MARFRVLLSGGPVFLKDEESDAVARCGFYTTRWVRASNPEDAGALACEMVTRELVTITLNPREPAIVSVKSVHALSWMESLRRRSAGGGFTFFTGESDSSMLDTSPAT